MFLCAAVENNACTQWVEFGITVEQAFMLGGAFLGVTILAWSSSFIYKVVLNRF